LTGLVRGPAHTCVSTYLNRQRTTALMLSTCMQCVDAQYLHSIHTPTLAHTLGTHLNRQGKTQRAAPAPTLWPVHASSIRPCCLLEPLCLHCHPPTHYHSPDCVARRLLLLRLVPLPACSQTQSDSTEARDTESHGGWAAGVLRRFDAYACAR
jgi:hypothetical protein